MITFHPHDMNASSVLYNGKIYTVDEVRPWVSAVAIRDGHIVGVGDDEQMLAMAGSTTEVIDLAGRCSGIGGYLRLRQTEPAGRMRAP